MKRVHSLSFFKSPQSGYESPRAGTSQGIFFLNFIPTTIRAHFAVWPDWELRIYHDRRVMEYPCWPWLERLAEAKMLTLVDKGETRDLCYGMLWRMEPLFDPDVEYFICRDIDSLPMHRDRAMVEEFIASGATAHCILDSESHSGPYMGGMVGWNAPKLRAALNVKSLDEMIALYGVIDLSIHGSDQRLLNGIMTARVGRETFIHQRRTDVLYPWAMKTQRVAPQLTSLDKIVRHIGAGYNREEAARVLATEHPETPAP